MKIKRIPIKIRLHTKDGHYVYVKAIKIIEAKK